MGKTSGWEREGYGKVWLLVDCWLPGFFGWLAGPASDAAPAEMSTRQAKQAGKAEMKKADKSLREWGDSKDRRGGTAF